MANGPGEGTELRWALPVQAGEGRATRVGHTGEGEFPGDALCQVEVGAVGQAGGHAGARKGLGLSCRDGDSVREGLRTNCMRLLGKPSCCFHTLGFPCELEVPGARQPGRVPPPTTFGAPTHLSSSLGSLSLAQMKHQWVCFPKRGGTSYL